MPRVPRLHAPAVQHRIGHGRQIGLEPDVVAARRDEEPRVHRPLDVPDRGADAQREHQRHGEIAEGECRSPGQLDCAPRSGGQFDAIGRRPHVSRNVEHLGRYCQLHASLMRCPGLSFTVPAWVAYLVHAAAAVAAAGLVVARRRGGDGLTLRVFEIATAVSVACALLALTSGPVFIDFDKAYLYAGRVALTEPSRLYECTRGQCFVNIPIVALLFAPLAPLNSTRGRPPLLDRRRAAAAGRGAAHGPRHGSRRRSRGRRS